MLNELADKVHAAIRTMECGQQGSALTRGQDEAARETMQHLRLDSNELGEWCVRPWEFRAAPASG